MTKTLKEICNRPWKYPAIEPKFARELLKQEENSLNALKAVNKRMETANQEQNKEEYRKAFELSQEIQSELVEISEILYPEEHFPPA